jgi:chitinase
VKVLLSVGGSGYNKSWDKFSAEPLARLVKALGADGVDLDYEPPAPNCASAAIGGQSTFRCASEDVWVRAIRETRALLPRPYLVSVQAWSVGAYGAGKFSGEIPISPWTGSMLWLNRLPEAKEIDVVAVMAYDAGPTLDPERAFAAYRAVWPGQLLLGIEIPAEGSKELHPPVARIKKFAADQAKDPLGGILLYAVTEEVKDGPSLNKPDGEVAAQAICQGLGRKDCD